MKLIRPIPDGNLWRPGYVGVLYLKLVLDQRQSQVSDEQQQRRHASDKTLRSFTMYFWQLSVWMTSCMANINPSLSGNISLLSQVCGFFVNARLSCVSLRDMLPCWILNTSVSNVCAIWTHSRCPFLALARYTSPRHGRLFDGTVAWVGGSIPVHCDRRTLPLAPPTTTEEGDELRYSLQLCCNRGRRCTKAAEVRGLRLMYKFFVTWTVQYLLQKIHTVGTGDDIASVLFIFA
jgi:hypothetical protein